jgi:acyl carrier protein
MDANEVRLVVAEHAGIDVADVTDDLAVGEIETWDSLAHAIIVTALEERSGVRFPDEVLVGLRSVADLIDAVSAG